MKFPHANSIPLFLAVTVAMAIGAGQATLAQEEPEEELEIIEIGNPYDEADDDIEASDGESGSEDEIFDGLVYDQESQQYQLIEDPEDEDIEEPPSQRETDIEEIRRLFALYKESVTGQNYLTSLSF